MKKIKAFTNGTSPSTMFNNFPEQILGGGYSSDMQMPVMQCLTQSSINFSGGGASISAFSNSVSLDSFLATLNIQYTSNSGIWIFSSDAEASYARHVNDTAYTQSFYFIEDIQFPSKTFNFNGYGITALNGFGQGVYNAGPEQFRAVCGDQVAIQETLGAGLFATLQLNFYSMSDKATFVAHAGASFASILDAFGQIQAVVSDYALTGFLEFSVFQAGGDATKLAQVLSKDPNTGNYYLTTCSLNSLSDCSGAINGVLNYAANDFPNQIGYSDGQINGNAIARSFIFYDYNNLGLNVGNSTVTPLIEVARAELIALYLGMQEQNLMVSKIFASQIGAYVEPITKSILNNFTNAVAYNTALITDPIKGIMGCYINPTNCLVVAYNINSNLLPINSTQIDEIISGFQTGYNFGFVYSTNTPFLPLGNNIYLPFITNVLRDTVTASPKVLSINDNTLTLGFDSYLLFLDQGYGLCNLWQPLNSFIELNQSSPNEFKGYFTDTYVNLCYEVTPPQIVNDSITITAIDSGIF